MRFVGRRRLDAPLIASGRFPYTFSGVLSPLDWHAALVAFGLIFVSELGDKTQCTS